MLWPVQYLTGENFFWCSRLAAVSRQVLNLIKINKKNN